MPLYSTSLLLYFETLNQRYLLICKQPPNTIVHLSVKSVEHISVSGYLMDFTLIIQAIEHANNFFYKIKTYSTKITRDMERVLTSGQINVFVLY